MSCYYRKLFYAVTLGAGKASLGILCTVLVRKRAAKRAKRRKNLQNVR